MLHQNLVNQHPGTLPFHCVTLPNTLSADLASQQTADTLPRQPRSHSRASHTVDIRGPVLEEVPFLWWEHRETVITCSFSKGVCLTHEQVSPHSNTQNWHADALLIYWVLHLLTAWRRRECFSNLKVHVCVWDTLLSQTWYPHRVAPLQKSLSAYNTWNIS